MKKINVVIYGATGSIGSSTLSVISNNFKSINIEGLTCNTNIRKLIKIAKSYNVRKIGFNERSINSFRKINLNEYEVYNDLSSFHKMISNKTDIIIFGISGISSFDLLIKVLKTGKKVGIANKECIISLGEKLNSLSKKYSTQIVPLDSEHNSIYHLLNKNLGRYSSITITASGGPFLNYNKNQLEKVTVKQAIKHPVWSMGKKISIDSATMINKALEIIEAKYLFNLKNEEINALIHPQAIVHALVNYENGASTAILSKPEMTIPISSLFFKFNKFTPQSHNLDLIKLKKLEFLPVDNKKFPAIRLGHDVMKMGGLAPHVFNYLNELIVKLFIEKKIKFVDIIKLNENNLEKVFYRNSNVTNPKLTDIREINKWIDANIIWKAF